MDIDPDIKSPGKPKIDRQVFSTEYKLGYCIGLLEGIAAQSANWKKPIENSLTKIGHGPPMMFIHAESLEELR